MTLSVDREKVSIEGMMLFEIVEIDKTIKLRRFPDGLEMHLPHQMAVDSVGREHPTFDEQIEVGDKVALVTRVHRDYAGNPTRWKSWEWICHANRRCCTS